VTVFFFAFIGPFSQNHFRLRVRIKRQVLPMGCGMSDNKDWHGRWRRDRFSNRPRIVTTKSRVNFPSAIRSRSNTFEHSLSDVASRSFRRRGEVGSTRTKKPTLQYSNTPVRHHSSTPFFHYPFPPLVQHSSTARLEARHDPY
jgi:hypothetical protein